MKYLTHSQRFLCARAPLLMLILLGMTLADLTLETSALVHSKIDVREGDRSPPLRPPTGRFGAA